MLPSFHPGDQFFADVKHITLADLHDGDVILLRHNDGIILKRILAMPGETISGADRRVYRNGKQLDEPYLAPATNDQTIAPITFAPRTIAAGELFVMGDNRDDSLDSRFPDYGPVRISDVVGKYNWTYSHALPDTKDR